jgi:hypothetical protein
VAAQIGDSDAVDPPQNPVADVVRTFTVDSAPTITGVTPANAAVNVGLASNIVVTFSEPVNFTAAAFTLQCPGGNAIAFTVTGSGTNTATIDPTPATLPVNTLCLFTANAALITDLDSADPPDAGTGTTTVSFTTVNDQPPSVSLMEVEVGNVFTAVPLGAGVGADANTQIRVTFSETVNPTGVWGQLLCSISGSRTIGSGLGVTVLDPVFVLTPSVNLSAGDACTLTVFANQVVDDDTIDPPDNMAANFVATFNVDAAPTVTAFTPANGATGISTATTITATFSEPVDIASAGDFSLECGPGMPIGYTVTSPPILPASTGSVTLVPAGNLPDGTACTFTVLGSIGDSDIADPPNAIGTNITSTFTTDAAPAVTTVTPANGATSVNPASVITINFSEAVQFSTLANAANPSFDLECPPGTPADFTVTTASPATSVVLDPLDTDLAGSGCTLYIRAAGIVDVDTVDPPDNLLGDVVTSFTVATGTLFGSDVGYDGYALTPPTPSCDDISATGTPTLLTDDSNIVVPMGFAFPVYGTSHTQANIQSNGVLRWGDALYLSFSNSCLPSPTNPASNNLYVFWDDLNPSTGASEVYYQTLGTPGNRRFVVQWDTAHFGGDATDLIRFQAMLMEATGEIRVCYPDTLSASNVGNSGAEATSGIQRDATTGFDFSCNTPDLVNGTELRYVPR